jgi:hypothetical protein
MAFLDHDNYTQKSLSFFSAFEKPKPSKPLHEFSHTKLNSGSVQTLNVLYPFLDHDAYLQKSGLNLQLLSSPHLPRHCLLSFALHRPFTFPILSPARTLTQLLLLSLLRWSILQHLLQLLHQSHRLHRHSLPCSRQSLIFMTSVQ